MARHLSPRLDLRAILGVALVLALGIAGWLAWERYAERYTVTRDEGGQAVTQVIAARLSGASALKVSQLSGTVQSTASDVRGFGMLRSDQVVKAPFTVDYFIDVARIDAGDMQWDAETRTLIVDAPDLTLSAPNIDESSRSLVRTRGFYVTRQAGEALSQRASRGAAVEAEEAARAPERMAQARENGRRALAGLLGAPLAASGNPNARVVVTFPAERGARSSEPSDRSRSLEEVIGDTNR